MGYSDLSVLVSVLHPHGSGFSFCMLSLSLLEMLNKKNNNIYDEMISVY